MADQQTSNGGGYGNPGADAQSDYQARAQSCDASSPNAAPQDQGQYESPSAQMAQDFGEDGEMSSQPSEVCDAAVEGTGMGLHNQSEAYRSQTQIAYEDGTALSAQGYDESADYGEEE